MLDKQRHLTNWVPIVCPFTEWNIWYVIRGAVGRCPLDLREVGGDM